MWDHCLVFSADCWCLERCITFYAHGLLKRMPKKTELETTPDTPATPVQTGRVYLLLGVLTFATSITFWLILHQLLSTSYDSVQQNPYFLFEAAIALFCYAFLFTMIVSISSMIHAFHVRLMLFALIPIGIIVINHQFLGVIPLAMLMLGGVLLIDYLGRKDTTNLIAPEVTRSYGPRLTWVNIIFALATALLFYNAGTANLSSFNFKIPPRVLDQAVHYAQPILEQQIAEQQDEMIDRVITQLESQFPVLENVPQEDKELLLQGEVTATTHQALQSQGFSNLQIDQIAQQLKQNLPEQATVSRQNVIEQTLTQAKAELQSFLDKTISDNRGLLPAILSTVVFFSINFFGIVFNLIALLLSRLLITALLKIGWITYKEETVQTKRYSIV